MTKNAKKFYVATLVNRAPTIYEWDAIAVYIEPVKSTTRFNLSCYIFANEDQNKVIEYCVKQNIQLNTLFSATPQAYLAYVYQFYSN